MLQRTKIRCYEILNQYKQILYWYFLLNFYNLNSNLFHYLRAVTFIIFEKVLKIKYID